MFRTGVPVKGQDFLDRKKHLPTFRRHLENNQPVMIKAPRRFGKTSLIKQVFEHEGGYEYIMCDLRRAVSLKKLSEDIIDKAYAIAGVEGFVMNALIKGGSALLELFRKLKSAKIEHIGEITLEQLQVQTDDIELFLSALDTADKVGSKLKVNIKIVLDEFQDILVLADESILNRLRTVAQHHENLTYIFLGSIESIMTKIFEKKASPFFHFAQIMQLPPFDVGEIVEAAKERLGAIGINQFGELDRMIAFYNGHPDYTIQALQLLYNKVVVDEIKTIEFGLLQEVMLDVASNNGAYVEELISMAKKKKHHINVLHSIATDTPSGLDAKSLYQVRTSLEDMGLISKIEKGRYIINDILLLYVLMGKDALLLEDKA